MHDRRADYDRGDYHRRIYFELAGGLSHGFACDFLALLHRFNPHVVNTFLKSQTADSY